MNWKRKIWNFSSLLVLAGVAMMVAGPIMHAMPLADFGFVVMLIGFLQGD